MKKRDLVKVSFLVDKKIWSYLTDHTMNASRAARRALRSEVIKLMKVKELEAIKKRI